MSGNEDDSGNGVRGFDRRAVLGGAAGLATGLAGCSFGSGSTGEAGGTGGSSATTDGPGDGTPTGTPPVTDVEPDRARSLAERFAPTLYFDRDERWFPTDPRPYASERDGRTVVDGFDALDGYVRRQQQGEPYPDPTVFYRVVEYDESPLAAVQYWFYSAFDQFTANFHWHDWEVLQVFVDTVTEEPQLYVASAHSRSVPNNEFLDPQRRPVVLSELGSHSSGLSVDDDPTRFERVPGGDGLADITNGALAGLEDVASIPLAYGLPRDEGLALPYVVPELDGAPVYEHEQLPSVERSDLVPEAVTVRSLDALSSPPDLPARTTGVRFDHGGREEATTDDVVAYDLVPSADVEDVEAFTGPQLSFEFAVPSFAEDAVASHITAASAPWSDPRYRDPARDITERDHRQALADRYATVSEPTGVSQVVASVSNLVPSPDAPDGEGVTTVDSPTEVFALLESDPVAVPSFQGVVVAQDVPGGDHRLTINGAGLAPHSETVTVGSDQEPTVAGVGGEVSLVARESAVKLAVDPREAEADLSGLAVEDDFAGRLYDAPLSEPDGVYVHRGGAYTAEVRDTDDELGAFRVTPGSDEARVPVENPRTGKEPLATYLADVAEETRTEVAAVESNGTDETGGAANAIQGLAQALEAVAEAATRAAERAAAGDRANADQALETVAARLERVSDRLTTARGAEGSLPEPLGRAVDRRLDQSRRRVQQARAAEKLGGRPPQDDRDAPAESGS